MDWTHLEMWRRDAANLPIRSRQRAADAHRKMVSAKVLGMRVAKRSSLRKAKVAGARKLAVILLRPLEEFRDKTTAPNQLRQTDFCVFRKNGTAVQ